MKRETIIKRCEEKALYNYGEFVEWFTQRFPNESDNITSYLDQWIDRFNTGCPEMFMDLESKVIYNEILMDYSVNMGEKDD